MEDFNVKRTYKRPNEAPSKMMSFRISAENVEFLSYQRNKGGLINYLLRKEAERRKQMSDVETKENSGD